MKGFQTHSTQAGFAIFRPDSSLPELKVVGEEWAFPEYVVADHSHLTHEFHLQLTGGSEWTIGGSPCAVETNGLIAVNANVSHTLRAMFNHTHHFVYCQINIFALFKKLGLPINPGSIFTAPFFYIPEAQEFIGTFQTLSREVAAKRRHRSTIIRNTVETLAHMLCRLCESSKPSAKKKKTTTVDSVIVARSKEYIEEHLSEKLSVDALAQFIGCSRRNLFHVLKKELGISPFEYHSELRMEQAKQMLRMKSYKLTQLALDLGFASGQHFSAAFRQRFGETPSKYRNRQ